MTEDRTTLDATLIARSIAGDEQAFRLLIHEYQQAVMACTQAITRNPADAADAAQEAFIRFHRNLKQFDSSRPLKPWLLRIAANCSKTLVSKRIRTAEEQMGIEPSTDRGPASQMLRDERKEQIRRRVEALPNTMREVTSLFYLAECSCREVAEILEMTESAVKVALHRARQKLYHELRAV